MSLAAGPNTADEALSSVPHSKTSSSTTWKLEPPQTQALPALDLSSPPIACLPPVPPSSVPHPLPIIKTAARTTTHHHAPQKNPPSPSSPIHRSFQSPGKLTPLASLNQPRTRRPGAPAPAPPSQAPRGQPQLALVGLWLVSPDGGLTRPNPIREHLGICSRASLEGPRELGVAG